MYTLISTERHHAADIGQAPERATGTETPPPQIDLVAFADFLFANREEITRQWVMAVDRSPQVETSEDLGYRQLVDHLPQLCSELATIVREASAVAQHDEAAIYARCTARSAGSRDIGWRS